MDSRTLGGLLDRRAERDGKEETGDALRASGDPERRYDASRLRTDARKTGNFLRQLGVGPGRTVAIGDVPVPESVLALFGAALLGAPAHFVPVDASEVESSGDEGSSGGGGEAIDARVLIEPVDRLAAFPVDASEHVAYGGVPTEPEVAYFERDVWSENPSFPPGGPSEAAIAIETGGRAYTHRESVRAAERIVDEQGIDPGVEIAVRAPLADPRTVIAGVLVPLACGGTILLPGAEVCGDVAVVAGETEDVSEPRTIDLGAVSLDGE